MDHVYTSIHVYQLTDWILSARCCAICIGDCTLSIAMPLSKKKVPSKMLCTTRTGVRVLCVCVCVCVLCVCVCVCVFVCVCVCVERFL